MTATIASQILFHFQNDPSKKWTVPDILKIAHKPKKQVNVELYKLQRQNVIEKVQQTPPLWKLVTNLPGFVSGDSQNHDSESGLGEQSGVSTRGLRRGNTTSSDPELEQKIIDFLRQNDNPIKTTNISKGIGLNTPTRVNSALYLMQKRGFVSKVTNKPVQWALVPHVLSSGSSSDDSEVRPFGGENSQTDMSSMEQFSAEDTSAMEETSHPCDSANEDQPKIDFNLAMSMSGDDSKDNAEQMLIDGGGGLFENESKSLVQGVEESHAEMDASFQRPESTPISEDSSVNDETLAELKRLVEESIPTKDNSEENCMLGEENMEWGNGAGETNLVSGVGCLKHTVNPVVSEDAMSDSIANNEEISVKTEVDVTEDSLKCAMNDSIADGEEIHVRNENDVSHVKMETCENIEHVAKKQRITNNNAVLMAMEKPSPEIKREKEFDVPTETGMVPFTTAPRPTPSTSVGRGRAKVKASSSTSTFRPPLPPHELLRMKGELPPEAEKAFSKSPSYHTANPGPIQAGRGRGIVERQLSIPGQQTTFFSPTGDIACQPLLPSSWTQNFGRGIKKNASRGNFQQAGQKDAVELSPGCGASVQSAPKPVPPKPELPKTSVSSSRWDQTSKKSDVSLNSSNQQVQGFGTKSPPIVPANQPVSILQKPVKPSGPTGSKSSASSSFKLPPTPMDLVQNTQTWSTGVAHAEEKTPELAAQNAFLSALNALMDNPNSKSGNNSNNVGHKSQNFGGNSSFGSNNFSQKSQNVGSNSSFGNSNSMQKFGNTSNFGNNNLNFGNNTSTGFSAGVPSRPALGLSSAPVAQSSTLSTKLTGLTQNDMESSRSSGSSFSSESFNMLSKNPISALSEYAQTRKLQFQIRIVGESGPAHKKRFQMAAFVGNERFPAVCSTNKKDCRKDAADVALRALMAGGKYQGANEKNTNAPKTPLPTGPTTHFDKIASLSHSAFNTLVARIAENLSGRKVLAALVMKKGVNDGGSVISLGTGNRCITGPQMSLEGHTVNDSHAEIITRRGFIRFLYKHLETDQPGSAESIFEPSPSGKLKIKDGTTFHLYISTAPCGDGALFSPRDSEGSQVKEGENKIEHTPTFTTPVQGIVRTKIEGGEGTIPLESGFVGQTWDGILRGERLRTMSCSDKLCRWNILGMQGALLTHFLDPIYLESFTLGYLYDHGHLARALCCRLGRGETPIEDLLPPYYKLNHPHLGRVTVYEAQRGIEKTKSVSLNWCAGDTGAEVIDGTLGQVIDKTRSNVISRVAKKNLYESFKLLCAKFNKTELLEADHYYAAKQGAKDFQAVKKLMIDRLRKNKLGPWVQKPMEEKMFA